MGVFPPPVASKDRATSAPRPGGLREGLGAVGGHGSQRGIVRDHAEIHAIGGVVGAVVEPHHALELIVAREGGEGVANPLAALLPS